MRYLRVAWLHEFDDEPIELFSELDVNSREVRKVERFRDGSLGRADPGGSTGTTRLGIEPVPSVREIDLNPEFQAGEIAREEFERIWAAAHSVVESRAMIGSHVPTGPGDPLHPDAEDEDDED